ADAYAWGGESLLLGGAPVGELASVGWSDLAGRCVGLAYVRGEAATRAHDGTPITVDLWGEPVPASTWDRWAPRPG
ncbi:MAG TPA: glycine cleavage T C-terminal barrel domain-containing protein, partial [Caldimonas sp.]